jgi:D-alanyl-D-alanine carboxypeptidase
MTPASDVGGSGRVSAAVRVDGQLRAIPTDYPAQSVFPIYSITKTLTAICVLRLVETGAVHLDTPAREWLPEASLPPTITLTHLLRHTSGLRDYGPLPGYHDAVRAHPERPWTRQQFLDAVLPQGLLFAPGERFSYSNVGYMLLIDIVERVTGRAFAELVHGFITRPLALQHTSMLERVDDMMRCVPGFGSDVTSDGQVVDVRGRYHPGWCAPRLVASTVEDVTLVFDRLLAGHVLAPESLGHMLTMTKLSNQADEIHAGGMGLYTDLTSKWGPNYHHGGGGPGYNLSATVYTDTPLGRVAIAAFVNSDSAPRAETCVAPLLARLLEQRG